jgi:hypothetical protein
MQTIRIPRARLGEDAAARLGAALEVCVHEYRRAALDCPLAAGIVALHRRRRADEEAGGGRRLADTIRRFVVGEASRVDGIYLEAAAACSRAGGQWNCPLQPPRRAPSTLTAFDVIPVMPAQAPGSGQW